MKISNNSLKHYLLFFFLFCCYCLTAFSQTDSLLQRWTFSSNNADTAALRVAALTATVPLFSHLTSSNGTTVATVPAYSVSYGMAFGASTSGDGVWSTSVGGPGGSLTRVHYVQFTITTNSNYTVRVDSVTLLSSFYNTSSSTKLAVVYSTNNFTSDSFDVTGGVGPSGTLLSTANGGFTTPISLANQPTGPTNYYSLALNGATGVTITGSQSLRVRCYFSCGSSSAGRYASIKNFSVMGAVTASPLPVEIVDFKVGNKNNFNEVIWSTGTESEIDHYELEQSNDGSNFSFLEAVNSQNNAGSHYSVRVDKQTSNTFYRLKIVHKSLTTSYSQVIELKGEANNDCLLFPNPAYDIIQLIYPSELQKGTMTIRNFCGMMIAQTTLDNDGFYQRNIAQLIPGIYQITLENKNLKKTLQFIKQ